MNILRISLFNINKRKSASAALVLLVMLAAFFLNIGINTQQKLSCAFDDMLEKTNAIHNLTMIKESLYKEEYYEFFKNHEAIDWVVEQDAIFMENAKIENGDERIAICAAFINIDDGNKLEEVSVKERLNTEAENSIYLPMVVKSYGYKLGDEIIFSNNGRTYKFLVTGFYETVVLGIGSSGAIKYLIKDKPYQEMYSQVGGMKMLGIHFKDVADSERVQEEFLKAAKASAQGAASFDIIFDVRYDLSKMSYTMIMGLLAMLLTVFSAIIVVIILLVIRFRIVNAIEEKMTNIGALEAIGYVSGQVAGIYILENTTLAATGALLGCVLCYAAEPFFANIVMGISGFSWGIEPHIVVDAVCVLTVLLAILLTSYLVARKVRKYPPVVAFRGGIKTHDFKRNYFKLEKTRISVDLRLAMKALFGSLRQNIMIAVCIAGVACAALFGSMIYINFSMEQEGLKQVSGFEICNVSVICTQNADIESLRKQIEEMPEVRKVTAGSGLVNLSIEDNSMSAMVYEDFDTLETTRVYAGRMPRHENEVVITGVVADSFGKRIGDMVEIECDHYKAQFMITGLTQTLNNAGKIAFLCEDGMRYIDPGYRSDELYIYLKEGISTNDFIDMPRAKYGASVADLQEGTGDLAADSHAAIKQRAEEKIAALMESYGVMSVDYSILVDGVIISGNTRKYQIQDICNVDEMTESNIGGIQNAIALTAGVILATTAMIIMLIISLVVKTVVIRQRENLGIYKSLGYTTRQLMFQIAFSFMPAVAAGVLAGIAAVSLTMNAILTKALYSVGVSNMTFTMPAEVVFAIGAAIILCAFITAMAEAYRIRKITVYTLLIE